MNLKILSISTIILFIISVFVYMNENQRGTDLLAGSDYIKGLDINKVRKISINFIKGEKIVLLRDSGRFVLENHKSYPAKTDKVNDLIYKIASIQVREKVASRPDMDDLKQYELDKDKMKYLVELYDDNGKKTVSFRVGKSYKGKGNYLFKENKDGIYLSNENIWLDSSFKDFIDTTIMEITEQDIEQISISTDKTLQIAKKDNNFFVESPTDKKYKKEKATQFAKSFSSISFDDFYSLTEPKVQKLLFKDNIKIKLKNNLIYKLSLAKEKENYFIKLAASLEETSNKFVVKQNDAKEELKKIEDVIKAQADAQRINTEKGRWIYKIGKPVYDKLAKDSRFFL